MEEAGEGGGGETTNPLSGLLFQCLLVLFVLQCLSHLHHTGALDTQIQYHDHMLCTHDLIT